MKTTTIQLLVLATMAMLTNTAHAQFVKGNEAVKVMPDGTRKVEMPPVPKRVLGKPCLASQAGCSGGGWKMVEATDGLVECTEIFARTGTCKESSYGHEKKSRVWVVKSQGRWMQCQHPDIKSKCVSLTSLPTSEVQ